MGLQFKTVEVLFVATVVILLWKLLKVSYVMMETLLMEMAVIVNANPKPAIFALLLELYQGALLF